MSTDQYDYNADDEFRHFIRWAADHKLNMIKTKEIVFHRPRFDTGLVPGLLDGVERVHSAKLLGVMLTDSLHFTSHVDNLVTVINQRLFLLSRLRKMGLDIAGLNTVFQAIVVGKVLYALPALFGFYSQSEIDRINNVLRKAFRWGLTNKCYDVQDLADSADEQLFLGITSIPGHCLTQLLPELRPVVYDLRPRGHPYKLPKIKQDYFRSCYINRMLFKLL